MSTEETVESQSPERQPARVKLPVMAYFMAVLSALFVTFGLMLVIAFAHVLVGDWTQRVPIWLLPLLPVIAIGLGLLSGWQSLKQAKVKAIKKQAATPVIPKVVCANCGEAVDANSDVCPMCGGGLAKSDE